VSNGEKRETSALLNTYFAHDDQIRLFFSPL
jgi:hypothetical protein